MYIAYEMLPRNVSQRPSIFRSERGFVAMFRMRMLKTTACSA
jgi:hypothetical protein